MLTGIRNFAKSWPAKILMAVLALSFVGWGVQQGGVAAISGDQVLKAGSRTISSNAFKREYENQKKRFEQQSGQPITPEQADEGNLPAQVLNGMATREAFAELLSKAGIRPSDKLVLEQISKIPDFFDQITGKFDEKTFEQRLADNGLTPPMFDGALRDEMAVQHWIVAVQNGFSAPRSYGALGAVFALESRDLAYFVLSPGSVPPPAAPTDAQLTAFMRENKAAFTLPEMRALIIVPFTQDAAQAAVAATALDPAELKKRFEFRKDTLSKPETRTLIQIPVKDPAAAQAVIARLARGEAPAAIAKSLGVDAITFDDKPLTAVSDRKIGLAAFKMAVGQVAALPGNLGPAVVKVVAINLGREVTLDEVRPAIEAEIRKDMVAEKVYAQTQAFDDAHQGGANLADSARQAGVPVQTLGPITAQGIDLMRRQYQLPPKILETAFKLPAGGESEITELGEGQYFAVRVEKIIPAHQQAINEIRGPLTEAWMRREVARVLEAKAQALVARARKEPFDVVAASAGASVVRVTGLSRQTAQSRQDLGRELLGRAFAAKPGEVWSQPTETGLAIGRVDNVGMSGGPTAARLAEAQRGELSQALFREMAESAQAYARNKLKVKVDIDKARAAAGFEPKPAAKGKAAEKKG